MRILFANPNTSEAMTALMVAEARRVAAAGTVVDAATAGFGSAYIATRAEAAVAGHALLATLARHYDGHDAIVVGAFIIPAVVQAAKELMPVPVIATGEAGLAIASLLSRRFAILTIGAPARKMTEEVVEAAGLAGRLAGLYDMGLTGTALTEDQTAADDKAVALACEAVERDLADAIVLGAGSMEGMARRIAHRVPVPVVSPVGAAVCQAEALVRMGLGKASAGAYAAPQDLAMTGIDADLAAFLARSS